MNHKIFALVAGIVFTLVAVLHSVRIIFSWHAVIGGWEVPTWVSWLALFVAGYLGYEGLKLSKKAR